MNDKSLPKQFWAEAAYTSVYLLNRLPTKAVEVKTPIEAWSGVEPSAKHLKVFGSACYMHIPAVNEPNLMRKLRREFSWDMLLLLKIIECTI